MANKKQTERLKYKITALLIENASLKMQLADAHIENRRIISDIVQARNKAIADSRASARVASECFNEQVRRDFWNSGIGE